MRNVDYWFVWVIETFFIDNYCIYIYIPGSEIKYKFLFIYKYCLFKEYYLTD